jgi:argininosuccinate lyase
MDTVKQCLRLFEGMLRSMRFHPKKMAKSAMQGFTNATDAADYLVLKGLPFRDAHEVIGKLVLTCLAQHKSLDELSLEEFHNASPLFETDIYSAISLEACVQRRNTMGAPGFMAMKEYIHECKEYLAS